MTANPIVTAVTEHHGGHEESQNPTFGAEQRRLRKAATTAGHDMVGRPFPDAELLTADGERMLFADLRRSAPAVVIFYRGAWCPYCNIALRTYETEIAGSLRERGIKLFAISPQKPDRSAEMSQTNALSFPALSDVGNALASKLGILTAPEEDVIETQLDLGLDVTQYNTDGTAALPMPTTVIIDAAGIIKWIDVHPNYAQRTEPDAIISAIHEFLG